MDDTAREFFDPADGLAETATTDAGAHVDGILERAAREVLGVDTDGPAFTCPAGRLRPGGTLELAGMTFRIGARLAGDGTVETWSLHEVT